LLTGLLLGFEDSFSEELSNRFSVLQERDKCSLGTIDVPSKADPEAVIDRGQEIGECDGSVDGAARVRVAGADDLSAPDAAPDQAPGQQAALPERRATIGHADGLALRGQVEGVPGRCAQDPIGLRRREWRENGSSARAIRLHDLVEEGAGAIQRTTGIE